jgi:hypothetical protein
MMQVAPAKENEVFTKRLRRVARRQERTLTKSRVNGTWSVSEAWYGAGGTGLTLHEAESHLVGEVAQKAEAEFDELRELLSRTGGPFELDSLTSESVLIHAYDPQDARAFMKKYTRATGAMADAVFDSDWGVAMTFNERPVLTEWLRTLPAPEPVEELGPHDAGDRRPLRHR